MKRCFIVFAIFSALAACSPVQAPVPSATVTQTPITLQPTFTPLPPSPTLTEALPTVTPTSTPVACDPRVVDYCIMQGHFLFQRPIQAPNNRSVDITYRYASTANGKRDPHHGVEFLNKFGTPVYAAADGVVIFAGADKQPRYSPWGNYYGNVVVLQHDGDLYTLYAHLSKITVEAGKYIKVGEQVGEVGQTGVAIGSHLHFEVRRGDVEDYFSTQNPELWLIPNEDQSGQALGVLQLWIETDTGQLVKHADYTLQYLDAQNQPTNTVYYGTTYSADMLKGDENAALGDLSPGSYRLVVQYNGQLMERRVEVESGKLTQVIIVVK